MEAEKTVFDMFAKYLVEAAGVSPERIADPTLKLNDLGLDSLGIAELLFEVEERFGISLGESMDLKAVTSMTLKEATAFVEQLIEADRAAKAAREEADLPGGAQHAVA